MIKLTLFALFILIFVPSLVFAKAQSKTKVVSKVNGLEARVESDQPGEVDLRVENGEVEIRVSKGLTPTIFISDKKITPTIFEVTPEVKKEIEQKEYFQERKRVLEWIKTLFSSIFDFLFRR